MQSIDAVSWVVVSIQTFIKTNIDDVYTVKMTFVSAKIIKHTCIHLPEQHSLHPSFLPLPLFLSLSSSHTHGHLSLIHAYILDRSYAHPAGQ